MENNLHLFEKYRETDNKYTDSYEENGKPLTSVKPLYQIERATTEWGSFGAKWGVKDDTFKTIEIGRIEDDNNLTILLICEYKAVLFYPEGNINISSVKKITSKGNVNIHYSKECETDALSKGLSKLGFSADIYMGKNSPEQTHSYKNGSEKIDTESDIIDLTDGFVGADPEKVLSKLDQDFKKAVEDSGKSKEDQDEILNNDLISDSIKRAFIVDNTVL